RLFDYPPIRAATIRVATTGRQLAAQVAEDQYDESGGTGRSAVVWSRRCRDLSPRISLRSLQRGADRLSLFQSCRRRLLNPREVQGIEEFAWAPLASRADGQADAAALPLVDVPLTCDLASRSVARRFSRLHQNKVEEMR